MIDPLADLCDPLLKAGADKLIKCIETELKQVKSFHRLCLKITYSLKNFQKIFEKSIDKGVLKGYNDYS